MYTLNNTNIFIRLTMKNINAVDNIKVCIHWVMQKYVYTGH